MTGERRWRTVSTFFFLRLDKLRISSYIAAINYVLACLWGTHTGESPAEHIHPWSVLPAVITG